MTEKNKEEKKSRRNFLKSTAIAAGAFGILASTNSVMADKKSTVDENKQAGSLCNWLVNAVFDAYSKSKQLSYMAMSQKGWAWDSLPWYGQELESTKALMGDNFYSYGMNQQNRKTLEALFRYSYEQGLSRRQLTIEELFVPESLGLVEQA
ncbi:MAG: twin-arginine translocation signal domain-containing protein [Pseudomonadales bacterium]